MAQGLLLPRCYEKARHLAGLRNFLILWWWYSYRIFRLNAHF